MQISVNNLSLVRGILAGNSALGPSTGALEFAGNVSSMLAAMKATDTQRAAVGWHGMSIDVGAGVGNFVDAVWRPAIQTASLPAQVAATINTAKGGAFRTGVEFISATAGDNTTPSAFYTLAGGATMNARFSGAHGASGTTVSLGQAGTATVSFSITSTAPNHVVRVYGYVNTNVGQAARYSLSGANTRALGDAPAVTTAAPMTTSGRYWYEFDITLANTGTTTVLLQGPSGAAGVGGWLFAGVDPQYDATTPGLTVHRLSQSSQTLATLVAGSLDSTDTQPAAATGWLGAGNSTVRADQTSSITSRYGLAGVFAGADVNDIISFGNGAGAYNYGWTLADHERHLTNYVNAMAARSMPVIFVVGHLRHTATPAMTGNPYTQSEVIATYRKVARASSNAAFIDISAQWGTGTEQARYDAMVADTSRWVASEAPRYVHPGTTGHAFFGQYVANAVMAAW